MKSSKITSAGFFAVAVSLAVACAHASNQADSQLPKQGNQVAVSESKGEAGKMSNGLPRPEMPNPQFARADWVNLNGTWDYSWDDQDAGLNANWQKKTSGFPMKIQVPFAYESVMSGINDAREHERSWYHRKFEVPTSWNGQHVLMHFGAVHYESQVWINGQKVGGHTGGQTPFSFDVTPYLHAGQNDVSLRIDHRQHDMMIARGKQITGPTPEGIFYTRTSGIWQSVWLEHVGARYVDSFQIRATLDGTVVTDVNLNDAAAPGDRVQVSIQDPVSLKWKTSVSALKARAPSALAPVIQSVNPTLRKLNAQVSPFVGSEAELTMKVAQPKLWSPDSPSLYKAKIVVVDANGATLDTVDTYFGIRKIEIVNGKLELNGKPLYLKFLLDQGYWPDSILTPPSDQALQDDINISKAMGFNGVRKHQKLEDPRFLYWADQKGLLVSSEFASPLTYSHDSVLQFAQEWKEGIERDINHPSIIIWVSANESWGFPQLDRKAQLDDMVMLYDLTKQLDPSRWVIDNDGWEHSSHTDLFALHDYAHTGVEMKLNFDTFHPDQVPPIVIARAAQAMVPGQVYNGSPLYISEMSGIGYILPGDVVPGNAWGYDGLETSAQNMLTRLTSLYSAMRGEKRMVGFCITQLTDVEQEVNGLLTYHRVPKLNPSDIAKLNATLP